MSASLVHSPASPGLAPSIPFNFGPSADARDVLDRLATCADDELTEIAFAAYRLEVFAFVVRGACASELRLRWAQRLAGGRGNSDTQRIGVQVQMRRLAQKTGIETKTLYEDAHIYETFRTVLSSQNTLSKAYFQAALKTEEPLAAIAEFSRRAEADPSFTATKALKEVQAAKRARGGEVSKSDEAALAFRADTEELRRSLYAYAKKYRTLSTPTHRFIEVLNRALESGSGTFDRDQVFECFTHFDSLTVGDLVDDTGLSKERVKEVLDELVMLDLVEIREQGTNGTARGARKLIYSRRK
jgi:hypothetical protein